MTSSDQKVCLITGASRGIGKAIAVTLAREGHAVVVTYNEKAEAASRVCDEIVKAGGHAITAQLNVKDRISIQASIDVTLSEFGRLDVLVNNAGILKQNNFLDITEEDWDNIFDVNVKGVFNCCQLAVPLLIEKPYSKIINIASFAGKYGGPKAPHYSASKAAIMSLTKSLARIYAGKKLLVNAVAPGVIETDMFAQSSKASANTGIPGSDLKQEKSNTVHSDILLGEIGTPEDVANAVAFLVSHRSNYITGSTLDVNGGLLLS